MSIDQHGYASIASLAPMAFPTIRLPAGPSFGSAWRAEEDDEQNVSNDSPKLVLAIETPRPNLVAGMKWILGTYSSRFNRRHKLFGHLFSGRYKSLVVDCSGNGYLQTVCDYVHLNPVRAKLIPAKAPLSAFVWSSYGQYLQAPGKRIQWLKVERLLGAHGIPKDSPAGRRDFERRMESRRAESDNGNWKEVRRGWMVGSEEFRKELLSRMEERVVLSHYGAELRESEEEKAKRVIARESRRLGLERIELGKLSKSDSPKVAIARCLRQETTMTWEWITKKLRWAALPMRRKKKG